MYSSTSHKTSGTDDNIIVNIGIGPSDLRVVWRQGLLCVGGGVTHPRPVPGVIVTVQRTRVTGHLVAESKTGDVLIVINIGFSSDPGPERIRLMFRFLNMIISLP